MKKTFAVVICVCLALTAVLSTAPSSSAAGEVDLTACSIASGCVGAVKYTDYFAPCSGVLAALEIETGDSVKEGDILFTMLTGTVTAPEDGTVTAVFAQQGGSAEAVTAKYGSLAAIAPAQQQVIQAAFAGAHNSEDCKHLHVGDTLHFKYGKEKGAGTVIYADAMTYQVLITEGTFDGGKTVDLFLDEERTAAKKTGSGKTAYRSDVAVMGSGIVDKVLVQAGDDVSEGDALFTLLPADADFGASSQMTAFADGVVGATGAVAGQQVWKGQLIARVYDTSCLEVVAEIDEMDIGRVKVGDVLPVTMDTDEGTVLHGTVTEISGFGTVKQNATYYAIHVALEETGFLLNQRASVYIP